MAREARRKGGRGDLPRGFSVTGRPVPRLQRLHDPGYDGLDLYHTLLTIGWSGFFDALALAYALFNLASRCSIC